MCILTSPKPLSISPYLLTLLIQPSSYLLYHLPNSVVFTGLMLQKGSSENFKNLEKFPFTKIFLVQLSCDGFLNINLNEIYYFYVVISLIYLVASYRCILVVRSSINVKENDVVFNSYWFN